MKEVFITIALIFSMTVSACHKLTYYINVEMEYDLGPWLRANMLDATGNKYLAHEIYEDWVRSERAEFVYKILSRLKKKKAHLYNWGYRLEMQGDTVILSIPEVIQYLEPIKNEVTATLIFNGFEAVKFRFPEAETLWTLDNLTPPLILWQPKPTKHLYQTNKALKVPYQYKKQQHIKRTAFW